MTGELHQPEDSSGLSGSILITIPILLIFFNHFGYGGEGDRKESLRSCVLLWRIKIKKRHKFPGIEGKSCPPWSKVVQTQEGALNRRGCLERNGHGQHEIPFHCPHRDGGLGTEKWTKWHIRAPNRWSPQLVHDQGDSLLLHTIPHR